MCIILPQLQKQGGNALRKRGVIRRIDKVEGEVEDVPRLRIVGRFRPLLTSASKCGWFITCVAQRD